MAIKRIELDFDEQPVTALRCVTGQSCPIIEQFCNDDEVDNERRFVITSDLETDSVVALWTK